MGFVLLPDDSPSPATERADPSTKCPPEVASCACAGGDGAKAVWCGDACGEVAAIVDGVVADMVAAVSCCVVGDAQHVATIKGQEQDRIDGMRLSGVKRDGKAQEARGPETMDVPLRITGIVLEWLGMTHTLALVHARAGARTRARRVAVTCSQTTSRFYLHVRHMHTPSQSLPMDRWWVGDD